MTDPRPTGEQRLKAALQRRHLHARTEDPIPYDDDWGWWICQRLCRIEAQMKWIVALAASALAAEVLRILLASLGILQ